ncbi:MAG: 23S rRNA methyltransferase [Oceanospirillaceae bacterium]|nr:23S rRNA methyltransferase [Oceanospirillaceae bacterium]MBT12438.1 23S rRNA methyltransferase [Oceanospirillaceae bacterium]|tara:strand:- start:1589 stop:2101 length:513 start_codon:yes stop_codon:yes gene_type:complete
MIHIALINPKDVTNVGSALRAIGCYQADGLYYTGKRYDNARRYRTDTNKIHRQAWVEHTDDITAVLEDLPPATRLVAIELVENACPLPDFRHPQDALYVFGPEDGNLPQDIVDAAHEVVYVPTVGCMNLAATVNVVLYDRMAKQGLKSDKSGNELIRASRDNNNHLQVRS